MPSAIDTKISLSGLEEVKAKLTEVGAGAEGAFGKVSEHTNEASEGTGKLGEALSALGEKMGLPIGEAEKLGEVVKGLSFAEGIAGLAALGAAVVAAGVAFIALGEHAATATRAIANHAATLGITSEAFEGLHFAAASVGVSAEGADRAFARLSVKMGAAREEQEKLLNGGKEAFDGTKEIIDQIAAVHGDFTETLAATADAMNKIVDPARRAELGMKLMGKSWAEQMPFFRLGGDEIRRLGEEWKALGLTATEEEEHMATAYAAAAARLRQTTEALESAVGNIIGQLFTPGMVALGKTLADGQHAIRAFAEAVVERLRPLMEIGANVFHGFAAALEDMTALINRAFGTNFSTVMVVATGLLVAFARPVMVLMGAFVLLEAAIKSFAPSLDAGKVVGYVAAFVGLVYVVNSLRVAMMGLWLNPLGLFLGAAIALGLVLVALFGDTEQLAEAIKKYIGEDAARTFEGFVEGVKEFFADLGENWHALMESIANVWHAGWEALGHWFQGQIDEIVAFFQPLITAVQTVVDLWNQVVSLKTQAAGGSDLGAGASPFAGGGRVPGSGFGDVVRAMLTPGEFVHRVAAVRHYGLGFMQRLNNLQIPRFELGGLVGALQSVAPTQHFASGGLVEAVTPGGGRVMVDLTLNGESFRDMLTPAKTAQRLVAAARRESTLSAGKKAGWVS